MALPVAEVRRSLNRGGGNPASYENARSEERRVGKEWSYRWEVYASLKAVFLFVLNCGELQSRVEPVYAFFFQAEDGIRDVAVTGVQTCALPILASTATPPASWT